MADVEEIESTPDPRADIDAYLESKLESEPDTLVPTESAPATEAPPPAETVEPTAAPTATPPVADQSQGQTPVQSKAYQDFLAKYGGNVDAAAQAYWDTNNRAAQLARENEELKARTAQPPAPPAEQAKAPEPAAVPQEIQRYDTELRTLSTAKDSLDAEWKAAEQDRQTCIAKKAPFSRERERIARQIISGSLDLDRQEAARQRHDELLGIEQEFDAEINRLRLEQNERVRDYRDIKQRIGDTEGRKALAAQIHELASARQAEINKQNEASLARFGPTFFGHIGAAMKSLPEEYRDDFKEEIKEKALLQLTAPGLDLDTVDIPGFVDGYKAKFLAKLAKAEKAAQAKYTAGKTEDMTLKAPDGKKAVAPTSKTSKFSTEDEVDDFLNAQLGL